MGDIEPRDGMINGFATRDFGGSGRDALLIHGTGHNLAVWTPFAERLYKAFHLTAFDMRGHGQTSLDSTNPEQYWRDISAVAECLGLRKPLLIGHSTGGYAVTAHAASGGDCSGIVVIDGFVLDGRKTPEDAKAYHLTRQTLWDMFRYGWRASRAERDAYIKDVCAAAPSDWLNTGVDPSMVEAFTRRSFFETDGVCLRRPTLDEIDVVRVPDPKSDIFPSVDIYDKISVPAGFVLASKGLYGNRRDDLLAVIRKRTNRYLLDVDCSHNAHLLATDAIAEFILERLA
ncbi:MAG: alpha/beta hydrolase [Planctomycetota bacterium]